jgi:hypothetical protein
VTSAADLVILGGISRLDRQLSEEMRLGVLVVAIVSVWPGAAAATPGAAAAPAARSASNRTVKAVKTVKPAARDPKASSTRSAKRKRKPREVSRVPNRRTVTNMPRGWKWPPSKPMLAAGKRCTEALDEAGIEWKAEPREGKIVTPITLASMEIGGIDYHAVFRRPPFTMDCHLALAMVTHSPVLFDLGVRKVNFGSIFRFTKVRAFGKTKNVLSRHALGLAMDVVSFEDGDGNVVNVERDYPLGDPLLLAVEDTLNGSGGFRTVLTPRNDPKSHHDHFHIEADISYYDDQRNLASLREHNGEAAPDALEDSLGEFPDLAPVLAPSPGAQRAP